MLPLSTKNRRDNFTFWQRGKKAIWKLKWIVAMLLYLYDIFYTYFVLNKCTRHMVDGAT